MFKNRNTFSTKTNIYPYFSYFAVLCARNLVRKDLFRKYLFLSIYKLTQNDNVLIDSHLINNEWKKSVVFAFRRVVHFCLHKWSRCQKNPKNRHMRWESTFFDLFWQKVTNPFQGLRKGCWCTRLEFDKIGVKV